MDVDSFLTDVGGCGPYQVLLYLAMGLAYLTWSWTTHFMVFGSYNPGWTVRDPGNTSMWTNASRMTSDNTSSIEGDCKNLQESSQVVFDPDSRTVVTEWGLICDKAWVIPAVQSWTLASMSLGSYLLGFAADRFGRKPTALGSLGFMFLALSGIVFSQSWKIFAVLLVCVGFGAGGVSTAGTLYLVEHCPRKWRVAAFSIPIWNFLVASFSVVAYFLRSWRSMAIVMASTALGGMFTIFLLSESLRWLVVHGKTKEARASAIKLCRLNRRPRPDEASIDFSGFEGVKSEKKGSPWAMFKRKFIKPTLLTNGIMFSVSVAYNSIYYGVKNLQGDFYLNMIIFCILSIPFAPFTPILGNKIGRRGGHILYAGISLCLSLVAVVSFFVIEDKDTRGWTISILALVISVCLDQGWCIHLGHSAELFPTSVRASAYALVKVSARLGGMVAPFLVPASKDGLYRYYVLSACLLAATLLMLLALPETYKTPMSDTISQMSKAKLGSPALKGDPDHDEALVDKVCNQQTKSICM